MPSVSVKDAAGSTQTIQTLPAVGAAATAAALPVTIASDQTVPVSLASVPSHNVTNAGTFAVQATIAGANPNGQATAANSAPTVGASDWVPNMPKAIATANGATVSRINAAATTNATSVKASAGKMIAVDVFNVAAYDVFLKLYDKTSAPTVGTDTPIWTIPIKSGAGYSNQFNLGKGFATGIAYAITKLQADSDTTAVAAGDVTGSMDWI